MPSPLPPDPPPCSSGSPRGRLDSNVRDGPGPVADWHSQVLPTQIKTLKTKNQVGCDAESTTGECGMGPSPPRLGTGLPKTLRSFLAA